MSNKIREILCVDMTDRRDRDKQELCDNIHWTWDTIGREKSVRMSIQMQLAHFDRKLVGVEKEIDKLNLDLMELEKRAKSQEREGREAREESKIMRLEAEGWERRGDSAIRKLLELEYEQDRKINQIESELKQEVARRLDCYTNLDTKIHSIADEAEKKRINLEEACKIDKRESDKILRKEISNLKEENDKLKRELENQIEESKLNMKFLVEMSREEMESLELRLRDSIRDMNDENITNKDRIIRIERSILKKRDEESLESLKRELDKVKSEQRAGLAAIQSCMKLIYEVINKKIDLHDTNLIYHINKMYHLNSK
ncbi:hypothetical protein LOD99_10604 [Oopsacas minuta]|uniref:Uncharacterized protein n=1 Tax=Oopsacas minuta TaxID=111878 RepID=A0AAV7KG08_9METZ|nr:hypothetical protein LOD99_10604 [Oopsacas minuta]